MTPKATHPHGKAAVLDGFVEPPTLVVPVPAPVPAAPVVVPKPDCFRSGEAYPKCEHCPVGDECNDEPPPAAPAAPVSVPVPQAAPVPPAAVPKPPSAPQAAAQNLVPPPPAQKPAAAPTAPVPPAKGNWMGNAPKVTTGAVEPPKANAHPQGVPPPKARGLEVPCPYCKGKLDVNYKDPLFGLRYDVVLYDCRYCNAPIAVKVEGISEPYWEKK